MNLLRTTLAVLLIVSQSAAPALAQVAIEKKPMTVSRQIFDPRQTPQAAHIGPGHNANTDFDFRDRVDVVYSYDMSYPQTADRAHAVQAQITINSVKASLNLPVTVWLPSTASAKLTEHEDGHCHLLDVVYDGADEAAQQVGESMIGMRVVGNGADDQAARADAVEKAVKVFQARYNRMTQAVAQRLGDIFDEVTDHGRRPISAADGCSEAINRYRAEAGSLSAPRPAK